MMDIQWQRWQRWEPVNLLQLVGFLVEAVEVSVVYAICLFSVRDGEVAKGHWRCILWNAVPLSLFAMMRSRFHDIGKSLMTVPGQSYADTPSWTSRGSWQLGGNLPQCRNVSARLCFEKSEALRLAILSPLQVEGVDAATTPPGSIGAAFFNFFEDAFNILYLEKGNLDIVEQLLRANPAIQMRCSTVDRSQTIACIVVSHFKLRQINLSCVTVRGD